MDEVEAKKRIESFIAENNFTWTIERLLEEYNKHENGFYISFTAYDCINSLKKEFKLLNESMV
jgi:hypothetical protein